MRVCRSVYNEEYKNFNGKESEFMLNGVWPEKPGRGRGVKGRGGRQTRKREKEQQEKSQNHAKRQLRSMLVRWYTSIVKTDSEELNHPAESFL